MTPTEIQHELDELETRLERLRIKYEQYFAGVERALPFVQRKDVDRRFQTLHHEYIRNTGMRFRFQTMSQRFTSLQTHWGRIVRQIEEGTYKRDVVKARRLAVNLGLVERPDDEPQEISSDMLEEVEDESPHPYGERPSMVASLRPLTEHAREEIPLFPTDDGPPPSLRAPAMSRIPTPSTPPAEPNSQARAGAPGNSGFFGAPRPAGGFVVPAPKPAPAAAPKPAPAAAQAPAPAAVDPGMKQLYDRYIEARRQTGENTNLQFESVARQVRESLPRLAEKYKGSDVSLDVTIKDGKAVLRPVVTTRKP